MNRFNTILGLIFIALGLIFLGSQTFHLYFFGMEYMWPVFILIPGLLFEYGYAANRKNSGLLVPGGMLTVIGCLFFFETFTGFRYAEYTWPTYPLAVAFGLFQLYLANGKNRALLIPVFIIGGFALVAFAFLFFGRLIRSSSTLYLSILLIVVGLYLMLNRPRS